MTSWTRSDTMEYTQRYLLRTEQTQMEAAVTLGVTTSTISRWVRGISIPDLRSRRAILAALGEVTP